MVKYGCGGEGFCGGDVVKTDVVMVEQLVMVDVVIVEGFN